MKKFFVLFAVALMGAMSMNAQNVANLEAKKAKIKSQLDNYDDGIAKKWEFRFDLGYENNFNGGSGNALSGEDGGMINLGFGYNMSSNWYLGVATGVSLGMGTSRAVDASNQIPLMLDLTYRHNFANEKWSWFIQGRGGYMFAVSSDQTIANNQKYEYPNTGIFEIQPGVYYRPKKNIDLKFSIGYVHINPAEDTPNYMSTTNAVMAKVGMNIRKASKMPYRSELEEIYNDIDRQLKAATKVENPKTQPAKPAPEPEPAVAPAPVERVTEGQKAEKEGLIIFYDKRESELNLENHAAVKKVAEWAKANPSGKIIVKSYADKGSGNPELNVNYAKQRANKVLSTLVKLGVAKSMIEVSSYGDSVQPFEENDKNRCSIFELIP